MPAFRSFKFKGKRLPFGWPAHLILKNGAPIPYKADFYLCEILIGTYKKKLALCYRLVKENNKGKVHGKRRRAQEKKKIEKGIEDIEDRKGGSLKRPTSNVESKGKRQKLSR
ncbi:MAG: hypothetical protein JW944_06335 [Deltaproteobacteria bacterium]|nr:hypothetical protein [Deltaproteobacteria bacterium]